MLNTLWRALDAPTDVLINLAARSRKPLGFALACLWGLLIAALAVSCLYRTVPMVEFLRGAF